jgi:prepilin-type N-terminal cleavage/methylation domain-containing protein
MRRLHRAVPRRRRRLVDERGYTLVELLVVMSLAGAVIAVPLLFVVLSLKQQNTSSSRAAAVEQESIGLSRLTRDLRQIVPSTTSTFTWGATSASASITLPVPGTGGATTEAVLWSCTFPSATSGGTCTRAINGGTAVQELSGVVGVAFAPLDASGNALSSAATNPAYVGITMKVLDISQLDTGGTHTVQGITHPITLQDGVDLRNNG